MDPSAFEISPVTSHDGDLNAAVAVMRELELGPGSIDELVFLQATMRRMLLLLARAGNRPVGFGFAGTWPGGESYPCLEAKIGVGRTHRRNGIGSALFRSLSDHARGLGHTGFRFEVFEDRADALSFLWHRGFREVGRELQYRLDLAERHAAASAAPAGIEIVTRAERPDLVAGMYQVAVDAVGDIPGTEGGGPDSYEDWYAFEIERPSHHPETCFLALAGNEVVGYATLQLFGGDTAFHGGTLVKRAWRRRGIARALTLRQIVAGREAGRRYLHCETETRNIPMKGLLEELGYGSLPSVVELQGPLASRRGDQG